MFYGRICKLTELAHLERRSLSERLRSKLYLGMTVEMVLRRSIVRGQAVLGMTLALAKRQPTLVDLALAESSPDNLKQIRCLYEVLTVPPPEMLRGRRIAAVRTEGNSAAGRPKKALVKEV